jgi:hypothetical protein
MLSPAAQLIVVLCLTHCLIVEAGGEKGNVIIISGQ